MTELQRRKDQAASNRSRREAQEVERTFREGIADIRNRWIELAALAWDIKHERRWRQFYPSLEDFLKQPGIELAPRFFYKLADFHEQFVIRRSVPMSALSGLEVSKALELVPAIRNGKADPEEAIERAREMTVAEIRQEFSPPTQENGKPEQEPEEPRRASPPERVDEAEGLADAPSAPAEPSEVPCPACGGSGRVTA